VRVTREQYSGRKLTLDIEGPAGTDALVPLALAAPNINIRANGAVLTGFSKRKGMEAISATQILSMHFPEGEGWKTITVTLTW
jgi:hypothetical protein